jgi:UDP-2,3-diacylglucosamine pyrophosphatase LpxH
MEPVPQYSDLYVISDLHMGGSPGQQIFDQGALLEQVIDSLAAQPAKDGLALVINGDMVDFLAEPGAKYFDPTGAVDKLERISMDPSFAPVWRALQRFVAVPDRWLVITLGNHDLELALPWVREWLLRTLSQSDSAARGRVTLAFDGAGFFCRVGPAKVYCVHGNDVDTWNITDYEALRRHGRDAFQGRRPPESWIPNAGTKLVIDVMNEIKRRYPFVDLLKPEAEAVIPFLYALEPRLRPQLGQVAAIGSRLSWDKARRMAGFLSADEGISSAPRQEAPPDPDAALERVLRENLGAGTPGAQGSPDAEALLKVAQEAQAQGRGALEFVSGAERNQELGKWGAFWKWIGGKPREEILREALSGLKKNLSFDLKHADATYARLDELVGEDVDFLVAGHTHLERALMRRAGSGFYYNTGTWVRLIRLTSDVLDSQANFAKVYRAMQQGTMGALDQEAGLVQRRPRVLSIRVEGTSVNSVLNNASAKSGGKLDLLAIDGSTFKR